MNTYNQVKLHSNAKKRSLKLRASSVPEVRDLLVCACPLARYLDHKSRIGCVKSFLRAALSMPRGSFSHFLPPFLSFYIYLNYWSSPNRRSGTEAESPSYGRLDIPVWALSWTFSARARETDNRFVLRQESYIGIGSVVARTAWNNCWLK